MGCFLPLSDLLDLLEVWSGSSVGGVRDPSPVDWEAAMKIIAQGRDADYSRRKVERRRGGDRFSEGGAWLFTAEIYRFFPAPNSLHTVYLKLTNQ